MNTRGVIGKRIVRVEHEYVPISDGSGGRGPTVVSRVVLENGVVLRPHAYETGYEIVGELIRCTDRVDVNKELSNEAGR